MLKAKIRDLRDYLTQYIPERQQALGSESSIGNDLFVAFKLKQIVSFSLFFIFTTILEGGVAFQFVIVIIFF